MSPQPKTKGLLTVKEAQKYLKQNGLDWTEVWIRRLIGDGTLPSRMEFNSRVIKTEDLDRLIQERKS